jgi:cardiolipin synthase
VIVLVREVLIGVVAIALGIAGARRIDVVWAGKAGTLAIMFALPLFLWGAHVDGALEFVVEFVAWGFAIGGLALGWYAAARYIPAARAALAEGRAAREIHGGGEPA